MTEREMTQIKIDQIIRSRRRTVGLQVTPDAQLVVRVPQKMPLTTIHELAGRKLPWILRKQRFARENFVPTTKKTFREGEKFLYLGEEYELFVAPGAYGPLVFNGKGFFLREGSVSLAKWLFRDWYRKQAEELFIARVRHYSGRDGARHSRIKISNARGRWGSCSSKGVLCFSWRLVMAPQEVVDYVVAHEVVHLEEMNHSRRFWEKVESLVPDPLRAKLWLERHQQSLQCGGE